MKSIFLVLLIASFYMMALVNGEDDEVVVEENSDYVKAVKGPNDECHPSDKKPCNEGMECQNVCSKYNENTCWGLRCGKNCNNCQVKDKIWKCICKKGTYCNEKTKKCVKGCSCPTKCEIGC